MSRLQEYLKTPNPIHPQFFSPQSCQQDYGHNLFTDQEALQTKGLDESLFEANVRSPRAPFEVKKTPFVVATPLKIQKIIHEKLQFDDDEEEVLQTPNGYKQKNVLLHTTANKKYDLRAMGTLVPHSLDGKEGDRTLRSLSHSAYDIVCKRGATTYKMVSEEIINNTTDIPSAKQQKNIKRRIYDALNVMIALGKLQKKGRKIMPKKNYEEEKAHRQKTTELKKILLQKQRLLNIKRKYYKNSLKQSNCLKKLIQRNLNHSKKHIKDDRINMPLVAITRDSNLKLFNPQQTDQIKIKIDKNQNQIFLGDLDVLSYIKFSNK